MGGGWTLVQVEEDEEGEDALRETDGPADQCEIQGRSGADATSIPLAPAPLLLSPSPRCIFIPILPISPVSDWLETA